MRLSVPNIRFASITMALIVTVSITLITLLSGCAYNRSRNEVYNVEGLLYNDFCSFKIGEHVFNELTLTAYGRLSGSIGPSYRCSGNSFSVGIITGDVLESLEPESGVVKVMPLKGVGKFYISSISVPRNKFKGGWFCGTLLILDTGSLTISQYDENKVWKLNAAGRVVCSGI